MADKLIAILGSNNQILISNLLNTSGLDPSKVIFPQTIQSFASSTLNAIQTMQTNYDPLGSWYTFQNNLNIAIPFELVQSKLFNSTNQLQLLIKSNIDVSTPTSNINKLNTQRNNLFKSLTTIKTNILNLRVTFTNKKGQATNLNSTYFDFLALTDSFAVDVTKQVK